MSYRRATICYWAAVLAVGLLAGLACTTEEGDTITAPPVTPPTIVTLLAQPLGDGHSVQLSWNASGITAPVEAELRPGDGTAITLLGAAGTYVHSYDACGPWLASVTVTELATGRQGTDTTSVSPCN